MTDAPVELESQVILRLPDVPATIVRDILRNNPSSLKDRMKIKLDADARQGTLYLDNFVLQATLVDLPCIIESHKTIENKHIYKTADIAQMLICTEDDKDGQDKGAQKIKKEIRIDKKFLYPHGITPPLKNVRKRRFRRTLKKKQYSDQPELEKEVRRLLRTDYEAQQITWEVIDEEEQQNNAENGGGRTKDVLMQGSKTNEDPTTKRRSAVEHIFGEELSDSDLDNLDDNDELRMDEPEESRLTIDSGDEESQSDDTSTRDSTATKKKSSSSQYPTSFSGDMFPSQGSTESESPQKSGREHKMTASDYRVLSTSQLKERLEVLKQELTEISVRSQIQEAEVASIDNIGLQQRLSTVLDKLLNDQADKEQEIEFVETLFTQLTQ